MEKEIPQPIRCTNCPYYVLRQRGFTESIAGWRPLSMCILCFRSSYYPRRFSRHSIINVIERLRVFLAAITNSIRLNRINIQALRNQNDLNFMFLVNTAPEKKDIDVLFDVIKLNERDLLILQGNLRIFKRQLIIFINYLITLRNDPDYMSGLTGYDTDLD